MLQIDYLVVLITTRYSDYFTLKNHRFLFNKRLFNPFVVIKLIVVKILHSTVSEIATKRYVVS